MADGAVVEQVAVATVVGDPPERARPRALAGSATREQATSDGGASL